MITIFGSHDLHQGWRQYARLLSQKKQIMERLTSIQGAFLFLLKGLLDAEQKIYGTLPEFIQFASSAELAESLKKYREYQRINVLKLEQVFGYLQADMTRREHSIIRTLLHETKEKLRSMEGGPLKDNEIIRRMLDINDYRISDYITCCHFADQLNLSAAKVIIRDILEEERAVEKDLENIAISESMLEKAG